MAADAGGDRGAAAPSGGFMRAEEVLHEAGISDSLSAIPVVGSRYDNKPPKGAVPGRVLGNGAGGASSSSLGSADLADVVRHDDAETVMSGRTSGPGVTAVPRTTYIGGVNKDKGADKGKGGVFDAHGGAHLSDPDTGTDGSSPDGAGLPGALLADTPDEDTSEGELSKARATSKAAPTQGTAGGRVGAMAPPRSPTMGRVMASDRPARR